MNPLAARAGVEQGSVQFITQPLDPLLELNVGCVGIEFHFELLDTQPVDELAIGVGTVGLVRGTARVAANTAAVDVVYFSLEDTQACLPGNEFKRRQRVIFE